MNRRVVALLQARTDSTRLPKKVLKKILDKPMIIQELMRIEKSNYIDDLIMLTSDETSDDELTRVVKSFGFTVFRGSKNNVLERFFMCSEELGLLDTDVIVRLTGDCPVHDAIIIDELIKEFLDSNIDYMANCVKPLYPDGLDTEVFIYRALKKANTDAIKISEKEHVTPYIRDSGLFKTADLERESIHPEWRLTVDEPEDFVLIERIYNHFQGNEFSFLDIVKYLEKNTSLLKINNSINRNEGYLKSLEEDKKKDI